MFYLSTEGRKPKQITTKKTLKSSATSNEAHITGSEQVKQCIYFDRAAIDIAGSGNTDGYGQLGPGKVSTARTATDDGWMQFSCSEQRQRHSRSAVNGTRSLLNLQALHI
jgi:hypothetical protein